MVSPLFHTLPQSQHYALCQDTIHVPIEIIDEIVDYLQDKRSLLNCALTSKSWASSCRRHIFRDLELDYWSPFERWCKSICATPNGPHIHTRTLKINDEEFGSTPFLQHFNLFSNLRSLTINPSFRGRVLETISLPDTFGHLTDTLRSLSLLGVCCSPQTLMSLVTLFPHLENLELDHISLSIDGPKLPSHALERRTLKGSLTVLDNVPHNYKQFYPLLAEHDLQYREMGVSGVDWLLDSPCNTCLVKCSEQLESLSIVWSPEREYSFCQSEGNCLPPLISRTSGRCQIQHPDFQEPTEVVDMFLGLHAAASQIFPHRCGFKTTGRN